VTHDHELGFLIDSDEPRSVAARRAIAELEPRCQRTYTSSGAVIARSSGCYHYTPECRKLADFTSGVLVANLGHHPAGWWRRVLQYMQLDLSKRDGEFTSAVPLTAYNAITEVEVEASRRLLANLREQPGGTHLEQVLWAASGSEAVQKALKAALVQRPGSDVILATRAGFHGKKGLAEAVTGCEQDDERDERVHFIGFPRDECCSIARRANSIDLTPYKLELERLLARFGERICCVITEPYLGGGG
jgi:4-aminobutyrate aminotransferase-like enzyme